MGPAAKPMRENRTTTVDFQNEATYFQFLGDGKAFLECVMAFMLSLGFQLRHKATCRGGGCLTRHSHYMRVRVGGSHHLACPVHDVQSRVHHPAAFHLALSLDATGGGPRGIVKLTIPERITRHSGRRVSLGPSLCGYGRIRDLPPDPESVRHLLTVLGGGEEMSTRSEVLGNRAIGGEKALGVP